LQSLKAVVPNADWRTGKRHALFDILHNNHTSQRLPKNRCSGLAHARRAAENDIKNNKCETKTKQIVYLCEVEQHHIIE